MQILSAGGVMVLVSGKYFESTGLFRLAVSFFRNLIFSRKQIFETLNLKLFLYWNQALQEFHLLPKLQSDCLNNPSPKIILIYVRFISM